MFEFKRKGIKLLGPLLSLDLEQGGSVGPLTFTKDGKVYVKNAPINPRTATQGNVRQTMGATQKAIALMGPISRAAVASLSPSAKLWNSFLGHYVVGSAFAGWNEAMGGWSSLATADRTAWETAATTAGFVEFNIDYTTADGVTPGVQAFALAYGLHRLGLGVGEPAAGNSATWIAYITG